MKKLISLNEKKYFLMIILILNFLNMSYQTQKAIKELEFLSEKSLKNSESKNGQENLLTKLREPSDFDSYTYSIQWGNTMCIPSEQCREKTKNMKKNVFTLHGLWPNGRGGKQLPNCNSGEKIYFEINDDDLQNNMNIHWPSFKGANEGFWEHEYNKHGYCYAHKYNVGQTEFFGKAMDLFLKYEFEDILAELMQDPDEDEVIVSRKDIRKIIKKKYPNLIFDIDCKLHNHQNYLEELRFYFDLNFNSYDPHKARKNNCIFGDMIHIQKMPEKN